ncbi:hypothetical protein AYO40_05350 [Planctomycetaceae bacterium SCGC AG-212-D15]|nr:hypothetical protein AYO40_05350 [Planctomycetaceae bacterium SCGC AG-212-D15]
MKFARWVFLAAGISGVMMIIPAYFLEAKTGADYPPPINHPEYYYGFFGVTLAWQLLFLVIGSAPVRYRPAMLPAMVEKASFAFAIPVLFALDRVPAIWLGPASMDGTWLLLFVISYLKTPRESPPG